MKNEYGINVIFDKDVRPDMRVTIGASDEAARGVFDEEVVPVEVKKGKKTFTADRDDHLTPDSNVETLANLGWIARHGGDAYGALGVGKSRGTKTLSLNERFARPGIYEVPLGTSLSKVLVDLAGGLKDGRPIKAVQIGGPLGGILPASLLDTPIGFEELDAVGALLGHGGVDGVCVDLQCSIISVEVGIAVRLDQVIDPAHVEIVQYVGRRHQRCGRGSCLQLVDRGLVVVDHHLRERLHIGAGGFLERHLAGADLDQVGLACCVDKFLRLSRGVLCGGGISRSGFGRWRCQRGVRIDVVAARGE